jgi:dehydratase family protein
MSGTAYGAIVLHVSPEAALGGRLALVRNGDRIRLDALTAPSTCSSTMPNSAGAAPGSSFPSRPGAGGATERLRRRRRPGRRNHRTG